MPDVVLPNAPGAARSADCRAGYGLSPMLRSDQGPEARTASVQACGAALGASHNDLFAILQRCDNSGRPDAWFGHQSIDPADGKRSVPPPYDPKGRKDLFQVLSQAEAAPPSSDSWMGHAQVDPSKGKKSCAGPEQRMGRQNLFPIVQQVRACLQRALHHAPHAAEHRAHKSDVCRRIFCETQNAPPSWPVA